MNKFEKLATDMRDAVDHPEKYPESVSGAKKSAKEKSTAEAEAEQKEKTPAEKNWLGKWEAKQG